ncbi:MAG: hypothetical protein ACTSQE_05315 [Candidatus Heimdallarchaeaceae archaeon]
MSKYVSPRVNIEELVFIEEQEADIKCGKCQSKMFFQIYYKDKETYDFLVCKNCSIYLQRLIIENEE